MGTSIPRVWIVAGTAAAVASLAGATHARAQQCGPRQQIVERLAHDYSEKPVGMGLSAAGALVVIYASPSGTWTTAIVSPQGSACVVDVGDGWTDISPNREEPGQAGAHGDVAAER